MTEREDGGPAYPLHGHLSGLTKREAYAMAGKRGVLTAWTRIIVAELLPYAR